MLSTLKRFALLTGITTLLLWGSVVAQTVPSSPNKGKSVRAPSRVSVSTPTQPPVPPEQKPSLRYETSIAHTRPELANQATSIAEPNLQEAQMLGEEGVTDAGTYVLPFGSKGEKVAIAFGMGDYVPSEGEKLQPLLLRLAQHRAAQLRTQSTDAQPTVYCFILLDGRLDDALREWLEQHGVQLLGFYPYTAYQARVPVSQLSTVAAHPQVRWVGQPYPLQKLHPELWTFVGSGSAERRWVFVSLFGHDEAARDALMAIADQTGRYDPDLAILPMLADAATINRLLDWDAVLFIEPVHACKPADFESQPAIDADLLWYFGKDGRPLHGQSVKIGVLDSGFFIRHDDFAHIRDGVIGRDYTDSRGNALIDGNGHGTAVLGILLGAGAADRRYRGTASGVSALAADDIVLAKVFVNTFEGGTSVGSSVSDALSDMRGWFDRQRWRSVAKRDVVNLSGGAPTRYARGTDALSRQVDRLFREDILVVAAAGNEGKQGEGTIGIPGDAKGALTVGGVYDEGYNVDKVVESSSRGPTGDGRVKPDVVAPSHWIMAPARWNRREYFPVKGTSFAAPHVAGLAVGLMAAYRRPDGGASNPPAWVIKSMIIANALDLGYDLHAAGRGKVDGFLCHFEGDGFLKVWWGTNRRTGSLKTMDFDLSQPASLLRIALVYPDEPASAWASQALVNDLDLYLDAEPFTEGPNGGWWSASRVDNVEFITIRNARAGKYRIKVHSYSHSWFSGSQAWAVTVRAVFGPTEPNLRLTLTAPVAVQPNTEFEVMGSVRPDSYVVSGVSATMLEDPPRGSLLSYVSDLEVIRYAPNGDQERFNLSSALNVPLGSIPAGFTRKLARRLRGDREGLGTILLKVKSTNGGEAEVRRTVIIDGTPPNDWQAFTVNEGNQELAPTCQVAVRDLLSGLSPSANAWYRFSTDGGTTWSQWKPTSLSGEEGSLEWEVVVAQNVPFHRAGDRNRIQFRVQDVAGNWGYSPIYPVSLRIRTRLSGDNLSAERGSTALLRATLVRASDSSPLANKTVRFLVDGNPVGSAVTNAAGVATLPWTVTLLGEREYRVVFEGDSEYQASEATAHLNLTAKTEVIVEDVIARRGTTVILTASLKELDVGGWVSAPQGLTLHFKVDGTVVGTVETDAQGNAQVAYSIPPHMPLGIRWIDVVFEGAESRQPSTGNATLRVARTVLRGKVLLGDFVGNPEMAQVTLELRDPDSRSARETHNLFLNSQSEYIIGTNLDGVYDVAVKGSHWLRDKHQRVRVTGDVVLNFSQINGDVDGDNTVTLQDFGMLLLAFGSVAGDENWNWDADLDGDLEVTLFDFGILVRHFGFVGEQ
ncbi:MAG: S8 family serine peptidase [Firmicutes bacterium]|nr:S8 family serine peptidase [Bacillota bacterium]